MKPEIQAAIDAYVKDHDPVGGFLTAVLENDLLGATDRVDRDNLRDLKDIVVYVCQNVPNGAWGSKEKVSAWLAGPDAGPYVPANGDTVEVIDRLISTTGKVGKVDLGSPALRPDKVVVNFDGGWRGYYLPAQLKKVQ